MAEGTSAIKCLLCTDEAELLDAESNKQREFKNTDIDATKSIEDDTGQVTTNGSENSKGSSNDEKTFDDQEELRQHLIAIHAVAVSTAFLYPNIGDEKHLWLMNCVQYGGQTTATDMEGMVVDEQTGELRLREESEDRGRQSDSRGSALDETMFADRGEDTNEDEGSDSVPVGDMDFSQLLSAFLNSTANDQSISNNANGNGSVNADKKRKLDDLLNEQIAHSKLPKMDFDLFVTEDAEGQIGAESTGIGSSRNGDVICKARNKVTCSLCGISVSNTARQRHVYICHVKKSDMYKCPKCDYRNSNSIWETRKHCIAQHGQGIEPISNEEKYKNLIMHFNRACFPTWVQKRPTSWATQYKEPESTASSTPNKAATAGAGANQDEESGASSEHGTDDITNLIRDAIFNAPKGNESRDENLSGTSSPCLQTGDAATSGDRICHLCGEESRYPGRHLAQKHLGGKSLYECPICMNFGSYEGSTVTKHIHKQHPDAPSDTQPVNNLAKYAEEIKQLQSRCFPNRPMKLVKSNDVRLRERHLCKMCGKQIAQSDRQRHVYHVHLRKERLFECPVANCTFASNYDIHRVKWHLKWEHKDSEAVEPISHENEYREDIDRLNEECFPDWQHRKKSFWWLEDENSRKTEDGVKMGRHEELGNEEEGYLFDEKLIKLQMDGVDAEAVSSENNKKAAGAIRQPMKRVSEWTCRLCLKEFKPTSNFLKHVAKDHLDIPLFQCPCCEEGAADAYEVKAHLVKAHDLPDLDPLSNLELNADYVQAKFAECFPSRQMKVTQPTHSQFNAQSTQFQPEVFNKTDVMEVDETRVTCQECLQEMKHEDRQIHVYRFHLKEPRLFQCPVCDFSHYASSSEVRNHIRMTHKDVADQVNPKSNVLEFGERIAEWNERCFSGWINRKLPVSMLEDFNRCRLCNENVRQTSRHIAEAHLKISLHSCPLCSYGGAEARLVKRHLKSIHHESEMEPISNVLARRADFSALHDKCFPGRPKRLSYTAAAIAAVDTAKQTKCKGCSASILRKKRLLHILEQHMKMVAYKCSECDFTHASDDQTVVAHIKMKHPNKKGAKVLNNLGIFEEEVRDSAAVYFPDWQIEDAAFKPFQVLF
ncbi:hypothetical protein WR25_25950 [Diploscapter pachys]|uniref:C2H2-type domain-containing protein n=1 Tax=Diploscapter pachys TaxID=2018661 RepID=A0A2A2KSC3_9BILA|nr:hypothetical protein WR25_25950 [Diploscapter pachys]